MGIRVGFGSGTSYPIQVLSDLEIIDVHVLVRFRVRYKFGFFGSGTDSDIRVQFLCSGLV